MLLAKLYHVIQGGGGGEGYATKKISLYVFKMF